MSAGQIIAQMLVGTPSAAAMAVASPATSLPVDGQEINAFAGLLRGLSAHVTTKPVVGAGAAKASHAGNSDAMGTEAALPQADTQQDIMATLLAMVDVGKEVAPSSPAVDEPDPKQPEKTGQQEDSIPQNVVLPAAGIQVVLAQQINGRMPESAITHAADENAGAAQIAGTAATGIHVVPVQQINGRMPESAVTHAVDEKSGAAQTARTAAAGESFRGNTVAMPEAAEILADSYNAPTSVTQQNAAVSASVQQETSTVQATLPPTTQPTAGIATTKNAAEPDPVRNVLQEMPVASVNVVSAPLEPEQSVMAEPAKMSADTVSRQTEAAPARSLIRPALDAYFQTSAAPSSNSMEGAAPAGQEMSPLPIADVVTHDTDATLAGRIPVDAKRNDLRVVQDAQSSKPDATDAVNSTESRSGNVVAAAIKKVMAPANGESFGQEGKSASDQKTGAQDTMMLLHRLKVESAPVAAGTSGSSASEPVRINVMEQVISQVREHVAGRDIKNGAEQVVIRLSPESLGELKLNLRMENQCLKVEIVAENSMVRDTLIKHSDTLKETLARQNIIVETFDVSTGNNKNGFGSNGQSQANWQELARQHQNAAWNSSGGYRVSDSPEISQKPVYQASTEHSMVDVHF